MRRVNFIENTMQDIRYALRILRQSPGFTAVAVLDPGLRHRRELARLRRPQRPHPPPAWICRRRRASTRSSARSITTARKPIPTYIDLRDRNRSFDGLAAYTITTAGLDTGDNPSRVWVETVSGNYFDVLRHQAASRPFFQQRRRARAQQRARISCCRTATGAPTFNDDPGVVGRVVRVNKHPFTILGVTPPEFHGTLLFLFPDIFVPIVNQEQVSGQEILNARGNRSRVPGAWAT